MVPIEIRQVIYVHGDTVRGCWVTGKRRKYAIVDINS